MLIFIIVLLPLGFIMNRIFTNVYIVQSEHDAEQVSENIAKTVHSLNNMNTRMVVSFSDVTNKKIILTNEIGQVLVNTGVSHFSLNQSELRKIKRHKSVNRLLTLSNQGHYFMSVHPLTNHQGDFIGSVIVFSSIETIYQTINEVRNLLIIASIGAFLIALGFTYIISRRLSLPLLEMEKATRRMAKGELETRVQINSHDEIGTLANAINDLAMEIEVYRRTRQEFFTNISHELKTPVTYLTGYAKVLKERLYETEEEHNQYLDIIENEGNRLNVLINDLFELSKMEAGRITLNIEPIDIVEILENVIAKMQLSAKQKGLTIEHQFDPYVNFIVGDGERIEQIFINLINNSIRYTEVGNIFIQVSQKQGFVKVSVKDTGIGIPEDELPLIYDRFYRIDKSRSRSYGGTGLGLSIVKTLTELQSGTIEVKSKVGEGTTFNVSFPIIDRVINHESI